MKITEALFHMSHLFKKKPRNFVFKT